MGQIGDGDARNRRHVIAEERSAERALLLRIALRRQMTPRLFRDVLRELGDGVVELLASPAVGHIAERGGVLADLSGERPLLAGAPTGAA